MQKRFSFTMAELVVVITCTAIAVTLGSSLLQGAADTGKKFNCIDSQKRIYQEAIVPFANDNQGYLPRCRGQRDKKGVKFAFAFQALSTYKWHLDGYISSDVTQKGCPDYPKLAAKGYDYCYNYNVFIGTVQNGWMNATYKAKNVKLSEVKNPATKLLLGDAYGGWWLGPFNGYGREGTHWRHQDSANFLHFDGHSSNIKKTKELTNPQFQQAKLVKYFVPYLD